MTKTAIVAIGLLAATLAGCGGVADSPLRESTQLASPTVSAGEPTAVTAQSGDTFEVVAPSTTTYIEATTQTSTTKNDDDRVVGLVSEWETDLAHIGRLSKCVERELGLERPLRPEDLQLKSNQPAIVSCIKVEVGNE